MWFCPNCAESLPDGLASTHCENCKASFAEGSRFKPLTSPAVKRPGVTDKKTLFAMGRTLLVMGSVALAASSPWWTDSALAEYRARKLCADWGVGTDNSRVVELRTNVMQRTGVSAVTDISLEGLRRQSLGMKTLPAQRFDPDDRLISVRFNGYWLAKPRSCFAFVRYGKVREAYVIHTETGRFFVDGGAPVYLIDEAGRIGYRAFGQIVP